MTVTAREGGREPQQDRSRATRLRVLEAAVGALADLGWAGSTVATVARRAGVSRGAAQHHFPTRESLFAAAFEHMAEVRLDQIRREADRLGADRDRTEAVLGMLSDLYTGPLFRAALHLHTAAAVDADLRDLVIRSEARVNAEVHRAAVTLLGVDEAVPGTRELVQGSLDLIRGLALADVLTDDSRRRRRVLNRWAAALDAALAAGGSVRVGAAATSSPGR